MRVKKTPGYKGFTLIELLVAMVVLSMLVVMFIQLTSSVARTTKISNQLVDSAFQSRLAYERIGMDLAGLLKRNDIDFNAANVAVGGNGNIMQFITGVTTSGKSLDVTATNNRGLSVIAYRLVAHSANNNLPCLVRAGKCIPWHGTGSVGNTKFMGLQRDQLPVRFTDVETGTTAGFPQELLPANDADYDVLAAGVIRMVIGFQLYPDNQPVKLQDGTAPNPNLGQGQIVYSPPIRTVTSSSGMTADYIDLNRISALVVGLVTIDINSQTLVNAAQVNALASVFVVPANGITLNASWAPIAADVTQMPVSVPMPVRQTIRVTERYFPITPFSTQHLLEK